MSESQPNIYKKSSYPEDIQGFSKDSKDGKTIKIYKLLDGYLVVFSDSKFPGCEITMVCTSYETTGWCCDVFFSSWKNELIIGDIKNLLNESITYMITNCKIYMYNIAFHTPHQYLIRNMPQVSNHMVFLTLLVDLIKNETSSVLHQLGFESIDDSSIETLFVLSMNSELICKYISMPKYKDTLWHYIRSPQLNVAKLAALFSFCHIKIDPDNEYCDDYYHKRLIKEGVNHLAKYQLNYITIS